MCGEVENFTTRQLLWSLTNSLLKIIKIDWTGSQLGPIVRQSWRVFLNHSVHVGTLTARSARTQCWWMRKRWDLTADVDSLSLLTRCRRAPLVHELLWLTVGWSLTCQPRRTTRKILASPVKPSLLWSCWQRKRLDRSNGRVRRQSLHSTI